MIDNIVLQYLIWHFSDVPREILRAWQNCLKFNLNYWSLVSLLKTFFSPWRKYKWAYPRGFSFGIYAEVFISNLVSRTIGAILRVFFIIAGIITEIFVFIIGAVVFLGWLILPALLILTFLLGFRVFF